MDAQRIYLIIISLANATRSSYRVGRVGCLLVLTSSIGFVKTFCQEECLLILLPSRLSLGMWISCRSPTLAMGGITSVLSPPRCQGGNGRYKYG